MRRFLMECRVAASNAAVTVINLEGELDSNTVYDFEDLLKELLKRNSFKIVLNMRDLVYISSAAIGVLVNLIKEIRRNRGDIKVTNLQPCVHEVFLLLELPGLFHILEDETDAVGEF